MARPAPIVVVCSNVAQAGRLAQGLGTTHGHHGSDHLHDPSGPRSTRHGHKGANHHLSGPRSTRRGHEGSAHHLNGPRSTTGARGRARSSAHASSSTAVRIWKVYDGTTLHEVQDLGTRLEARSEDGDPVWTGVRLPSGAYETRSTTFSKHKLESFLAKVRDGDQVTPGARHAPRNAPHAAPASANRPVQRSSKAKARKPASEARTEAPRAEQSAPAPKKRGGPKKPKSAASARPKSKAPASARPKSKAPASARPKSEAPASARPTSEAPASTRPRTKAPASAKPKQPAKAKRQPAARAMANGPATSRSPGSLHMSPQALRRQLLATHPDTDADQLATLVDVWRGGASEPARAWMLANGFTDLAEAFLDWVQNHTTEASEFMKAARAQRSA